MDTGTNTGTDAGGGTGAGRVVAKIAKRTAYTVLAIILLVAGAFTVSIVLDAVEDRPDPPPCARVVGTVTYTDKELRVTGVALNADGTVLVTPSRPIQAWDTRSGQVVRAFSGNVWHGSAMALSADGTTLAIGADEVHATDTIPIAGMDKRPTASGDNGGSGVSLGDAMISVATLWDVASGKPRSAHAHRSSVTTVALAPDGKTLATGVFNDPGVRLWDTTTGALTTILEGHTKDVGSMAFTPNGAMLVTGGQDGTVRLWDRATGAQLQVLDDFTGNVIAVAVSPDGKTLAAEDHSGIIKLWNIEAKTWAATLRHGLTSSGGGTIRSHSGLVRFSPDGTTIVTSSNYSNEVRRWRVATGTSVARIRRCGGMAEVAAISGDATVLAMPEDRRRSQAGGYQHTVRLVEMPMAGSATP